MFRLSKIADYGIIILAHLAQHAGQELDGAPRSLNARELAEHVDLPLPVVSKVLKTLTRAGVLESQRGAKGGYSLAHRPEDLSVADMITALDGPLAITQCSLGPAVCDLEQSCAVKSPWLVINRVVHNALASVTLADLTSPAFAAQHAPLAGLVHVADGAALPAAVASAAGDPRMASAAGGSRMASAAGGPRTDPAAGSSHTKVAAGSRSSAAGVSRIAPGGSRAADGPNSPTSVMADAGTDEVL